MPESKPPESVFPFESGLTRRTFIKQSGVAVVIAGLAIYKPLIGKNQPQGEEGAAEYGEKFTQHQKMILEAVQMQLFPADGDGPSAREINAFTYLEWALTDPTNIEDGDRVFIIKGIGWLEDLANKRHRQSFKHLSTEQQQQLMTQISQSEAGENWMALLIYYLMEALLLDPFYGGNPEGIGWKWLEHQPGFPRPTTGHGYQDYQKSLG